MPEKRLRDLLTSLRSLTNTVSLHLTVHPTPTCPFFPDCYGSTGGYVEGVLAVSVRNKDIVAKYLRNCKDLGFDVLELSSGFSSPH
jgi:hypothetical protein